MKKNKKLILAIFAVLSVILITGGVTYAFFNYVGTGTTDNVITTDTITFLYTEVDGVGNGIKIENAFPTSDEKGKVLSKTNEYFDFKVTSKIAGMYAIPYEVTARKSSDSSDIDKYIRLYLTKGEVAEEVLLDNYSELTQTSKVDENKYIEKTIYNGEVPEGSTNYEESFRLRMWLSDETRFDTMDMNNKKFTLTVNVYSNARVVTEEEIAYESNTEITGLKLGNNNLTKVEGKDYDYEIILDKGITSTEIITETKNPNATVSIEKLDNLVDSNKVKRLSSTNSILLVEGVNYFKVKVISENQKETAEYKIKITVPVEISKAIYNKYSVTDAPPTLTNSSNNTSDVSGLYKWIDEKDSTKVSYYFRGDVDNTVEFAGETWRIIRINEDGTIRLIMENGINNNNFYPINPQKTGYTNMYYNNSNVENGAKYVLDNWYQTNIVGNGYSDNVATGYYFCEQAKVRYHSNWTSGNAVMENYSDTYKPTFRCEEDGNKHGLINASVGMITYDEVVYAGGYYAKSNNQYYLYSGKTFWTMSPAGVYTGNDANYNSARMWGVLDTGYIIYNIVDYADGSILRPVINLKADTPVILDETGSVVWKVVE